MKPDTISIIKKKNRLTCGYMSHILVSKQITDDELTIG